MPWLMPMLLRLSQPRNGTCRLKLLFLCPGCGSGVSHSREKLWVCTGSSSGVTLCTAGWWLDYSHRDSYLTPCPHGVPTNSLKWRGLAVSYFWILVWYRKGRKLLFPRENLFANFRCDSFSSVINILWDLYCNHRAEKIPGIWSNVTFYLCSNISTLSGNAHSRSYFERERLQLPVPRAVQRCAQAAAFLEPPACITSQLVREKV